MAPGYPIDEDLGSVYLCEQEGDIDEEAKPTAGIHRVNIFA